MNEIVAISFRLINFGIVAVCGFYLFKKYGLSFIQEKIAQRNHAIQELEIQLKKMEDERNALVAISERQKITYEHLQIQLSIWDQGVKEQLHKRAREKESLKRNLTLRIDQQAQFLGEYSIAREVLPKAIEQARKTLQQKFVSEQMGHSFIDPVINNIKKSGQ